MTHPVLRVRTERLDFEGELLDWAAPQSPLVFIRAGQGIVGFGERLRLEAVDGSRAAELAAQWRGLSALAEVSDSVRMPGTGLVAFGSLAFSDESREHSTLIVPAVIVGRRDGVTWITRVDDGATNGPEPVRSDASTQLAPGAMGPARFETVVRAARERIRAGELSKVVIARDLVGHIDPSADRRAPLARLSSAYPDTYTFAVSGLIGSSPETLVRVSGGDVSARVLAGTARRGEDAAADARAASALTGSKKDRDEHDFAVQSVLDSLSNVATAVTRTNPYPLRLPNLWHLATDVRGELVPGGTALDLVGALHPTAAVAGSPTATALALIAEVEPFDRGRYAGPVGWVDAQGDGEWAIALRCAHITDEGRVTAWAGAGIVADSDPAAELAETELKFRPVVEALRA